MAIKDWLLWIKRKPLGDVIKHKHRFVVMDTDTFKEKFSFQLSGINLFVTIGITIIVLILLTTILIAFTPLREYIPGYTNNEMVEQTYENARRVDSIEAVLEEQEWLVATMQAVLRGDAVGDEFDSLRADSTVTLAHLATTYRHSVEDSLLRLDVEREDNRYEVKARQPQQPVSATTETGPTVTHLFFAPLKGNILTPYNPSQHHYGVDIAGGSTTPVTAAYNGTVVFAEFTADAGHVIALQHPGNVITVYRSNSALLKHQGDAVRAGEPIAYVGTGEHSELGPHLHLEVWVNGTAVNPEEYISF
ncbi:MAG: M23 family metallopeptidase [Bacteroidales bacterium]|nr:M23 family metallopeptidase [Bacteroidales bacterium]